MIKKFTYLPVSVVVLFLLMYVREVRNVKEARIECYSGGQLIYNELTSGSVKSSQGTYTFIEKKTGFEREVPTACHVNYFKNQ